MLPHRHFRLTTLGRLALESVAGESCRAEDARPRHLAVLAVLALSPRAVARAKLLELFWGGEPEERARHSLSNALSGLRALLGAGAISARRDSVALAEDVGLAVDAAEFMAACEIKDDERAASLYAGPFMAGVHVPDAQQFDQWLTRERSRLERAFVQVCERQAPTLLRDAQWSAAAPLASQWMDAAPDSAVALATLLRAEAGPDTPAAIRSALAEFERRRSQLAEEYESRPADAVLQLAAELRTRLAAAERKLVAATEPVAGASSVRSTGVTPALAPTAGAPAVSRPLPQTSRRRGARALTLSGVVIVVLAIAGYGVLRRRVPGVPLPVRPVVAVVAVDDANDDSSITWLRAGLPSLIANDLEAMGGLDVVAPSRVRAVVVRLTGPSLRRLSLAQSLDLGRRMGASWVVTGGLAAANGGYLLDVTAQSVSDPTASKSFTVFGRGPIDLGSLASTRLGMLLSSAPDGGTAVGYSGVETASADAYQHFARGEMAAESERFTEAARELDRALAIDSTFVEAIRARSAIATAMGDSATVVRLGVLSRRYESRLPEFDRLSDEIENADSLGESERATALSEQLVERYPRDPRAQSLRADLLTIRGRWAAAESVLVRELALDSLAMEAGQGPCTPCEVLWRLSQVRQALGDGVGAERAARRWVALQPDLPAAWRNLSATLAAVGKSGEAVNAGLHDVALSHESLAAVDFGRTMLSARRYDLVDSLIRAWRGTTDPVRIDGAQDLLAMADRERGQFQASVNDLASLRESQGLILIRADGFARTGRMAEARGIYERSGHPVGLGRTQFTPSEARGFAWAHALEADALLRAGDTLDARPFVDSLRLVGAQSYYGRDHVLFHHVAGMLLYAEGRYADAERELRAAKWGADGWTRTNVELARAQLAQGHAADAIATLRDAYLAPLDGMGRYVPHSELDWYMALAFAAAGEADSAGVYATHVRAAWHDADRSVRALLDSLPK